MMPPTPTTTIVFAAAMGMLWLGVIPLVSGYVAELFGTRYMATILGMSFVVHQMGSVIGAWGGGLIFDAFGSYDRAWQIGVLVGAMAGTAQILFGGPARPSTPRRNWRLGWNRYGEPSRIRHSSPQNKVSALQAIGVNPPAMRVGPLDRKGGYRAGSQSFTGATVG
jgi:MFS family permease